MFLIAYLMRVQNIHNDLPKSFIADPNRSILRLSKMSLISFNDHALLKNPMQASG